MQSINNAEQQDNREEDEVFNDNTDPSTQSLLTANESAKLIPDAVLAQQQQAHFQKLSERRELINRRK